MLHFYFSYFSHSRFPEDEDPIERFEDDVDIPLCDKVIAEAQEYPGDAVKRMLGVSVSVTDNIAITDVSFR